MDKDYFRKYYQRNKEKILINSYNYYHLGNGRKMTKLYQEKNKDKIRKWNREYMKKKYIPINRKMTKIYQSKVLFFD